MRTEEEIQNAIELYADMVRKICFLHMKQNCDVDDVFQNVFLKYANGPEFRDAEHEKAWLIRVSINACKDHLTSWFRRKVELNNELEQFIATPSQETNSEVLYAVLKLKKQYRNVIYLHYYEGYKIQEIADILQRNVNTIHTWMKRAKIQLKEMLGGEDFE